MDPLGFSLEGFDPTGAWRDDDETGAAIDTSGVLPDGTEFDGHRELSALVAADPRFPVCVTQRMLSYALGRETTIADACAAEHIAEDLGGGGFAELVKRIATSAPFRYRRGEVMP
jgi:hypothetical protein